MTVLKYPSLYIAANQMSIDAQKIYLRLITGEYVLLFVAACLSLQLCQTRGYFMFYALVLFAALGALVWRTKEKPEQDWYKSRALAESIKTSTWRYCMRAPPFDEAESEKQRRAEFRNYLNGILEANRKIGSRLPPERATESQVTIEMEALRSSPLEERKSFYISSRIREQRRWYQKKASDNRNASRHWFLVALSVYALAVVLALSKIVDPKLSFWPIDPALVLATSIIGWVQIKKFNELASAYTLTAFEIGIIQDRASDEMSDAEFGEFVEEAERAFSREHTQWMARQD